MYKWLDVKDYLVLRSTGNFITTPDSAHLTFLYDTRPGKPGWHKGLCKLFHVNPDHLPGVIEATDIAGDLAGQAAFEMGLEPGTPVIAGGGDASLIPVGAGCIEKYDTHIYLGTSGWVSTVLDRRKLDIKNFIASITGAIPHHYNYIAEQETAGICLEWVRDNLSLDETGLHPETAGIREPKQAIETLYRFLDQVVAETEPAAANVLFTPWLQGNRSPREDNNARGMFFNISLTTGKRQMIRSVLEGVAFHMRWMLEAVEKKVPRQDLIRFTGGGARSAQWAQILADITGRKIEIIENADYAGPTGAAIVSGIALGKLESVRAVKKLLSVTRTYHPRDKHKDIYDRNFAVFKDLYQMNKKLFKRLNAS
jgi:xylulokinase